MDGYESFNSQWLIIRKRDIVREEWHCGHRSGLMLSEYELLNLISEKHYTTILDQSTFVDYAGNGISSVSGPIHVTHEESMDEQYYSRPPSIRNGFDLFL